MVPQTLWDLEARLVRMQDEELEADLQRYAIFEHLNKEKITPAFLKLEKMSKSDADLSEICKEDGTQFSSTTERNEYIFNYYKNLYKKTGNGTASSIEDFLGPEILSKPHVINSKIPENISATLETNLTLMELEKSINECNTHTAPGGD